MRRSIYRIQTRKSPSLRAKRAGFPTNRRSRIKHQRPISVTRIKTRRKPPPLLARILFRARRLPGLRGTRDASEMKEIYVADVAKFENQAIVAFFAVATKQLRSRKDGGQYLAVTLGDRTGQIESRMWDNFAEIAAGFEQGDVVKVRAEVCRFNSRFQLNLEKLRRATPDEFEMADYVPHTHKDVEELWATLIRSVDGFSNPWLQALVRSFLEDPAIAAAFREAPAAKSLHHAWMGGLLEHVVSLMGICRAGSAALSRDQPRPAPHRRHFPRHRQTAGTALGDDVRLHPGGATGGAHCHCHRDD